MCSTHGMMLAVVDVTRRTHINPYSTNHYIQCPAASHVAGREVPVGLWAQACSRTMAPSGAPRRSSTIPCRHEVGFATSRSNTACVISSSLSKPSQYRHTS